MAGLLVCLAGAMAYLIAKIRDILLDTDVRYESSRISLTVFTFFTLLMCAATFVAGIFNYINFGKGLKEACKFEDINIYI